MAGLQRNINLWTVIPLYSGRFLIPLYLSDDKWQKCGQQPVHWFPNIYKKFHNIVQKLQCSEFTILRDHTYKYKLVKWLCTLILCQWRKYNEYLHQGSTCFANPQCCKYRASLQNSGIQQQYFNLAKAKLSVSAPVEKKVYQSIT